MQIKNWESIVKKSLADQGYRKRLLSDPVAVLAEEGMAVPAGVTVRVVESTPSEVWLVLPHQAAGYRFMSPYAAVYEDESGQTPREDSTTCDKPAAGCTE
jgi:hypothetical protein